MLKRILVIFFKTKQLNSGTVFSFIKGCAGNKSNDDVYKRHTRGV